MLAELHRITALGDIPVELRGEDAAGAAALRLLLGAVPDAPGPAVAEVRAGGAGPRVDDAAPDQVFEDRWVWLAGDELTILDATGVAGRADAGRVVIGGGDGGDEALATLGIRRLFLSAVGHLLGFHDRYLVHAAGVVVDGATVLVLGTSGAGKSTVALAALEAGWPLLSDDLTVLRCREGRVEAAGVPRPPTVPTDLGAPRAGCAPRVPDDPRARAQLPADVLTAGFRPVDAVLVVAHGEEPFARLDPVSGRDVHFLLVGSFPPASHPDQLRRAHPVFAALARLPARTLRHGADASRRLTSTAAAVRRFSRELAPHR